MTLFPTCYFLPCYVPVGLTTRDQNTCKIMKSNQWETSIRDSLQKERQVGKFCSSLFFPMFHIWNHLCASMTIASVYSSRVLALTGICSHYLPPVFARSVLKVVIASHSKKFLGASIFFVGILNFTHASKIVFIY